MTTKYLDFWSPITILFAFFCAWGNAAQAQTGFNLKPDQGNLLATGGVIQVEGAGGGGLVPWAFITGYGTKDSYGANGHLTLVQTPDFQLLSPGFAIGLFDRFEFSYNRHELKGTDDVLDGLNIAQNIWGAKVALNRGSAVYDQESWLPQIAVGVLYHDHIGIDSTTVQALGNGGVDAPVDVGAARNNSIDFYVAATKIFLAQSLLVNATVRVTRANQFGLLGSGGPNGDSFKPYFEGSAAYLITKRLAVGGEYRMKPRNLATDREEDAWDLFIAWFPTKNVSLTGAYLNLGEILEPATGNSTTQHGPYLSLQVGF